MSKIITKLNTSSTKMNKMHTLPSFFYFLMMVIFMITTGFTSVGDENNIDTTKNLFPPNNTCSITVDAGDDASLCKEGEVTLTATVSGESECDDCLSYGIENTYRCGKDFYYVLWLKDDTNNIIRRFSNVDLEWREFEDGTATLSGTVVDNDDAQITLEVDVTYSGRTVETPSGSPKDHFCNTEITDGWVYYTDVMGTITQTDGSWSFDISRMGPAFQLGNGANVTEDEVGKYGASGWFNTTDSNFERGDFNINIGDCINRETSEITYLWSTGETTPSITVTDEGTYSVTVKDCESCEATDTVEVTTSTIAVDAGEDVLICGDSEVTLTASVTGASECVDCTEEYSVENTDLCNQTDENFVFCLVDNGQLRFFSNVDLIWKENQDGTASLTGTILDHTITNEEFELDITFYDKTTSGSPGGHLCNQEDSTDWIYYSEFSGSLKQQNGAWSLDLSRNGRPFQLGNGANAGEREQGKYGASAGFGTTDSQYTRGDLNLNIGDCITTTISEIAYEWSTGETTPSITVSEGGTYTVTVKDCASCEATDTVEVTASTLDVDAGEDVEICEEGEVTLTATVIGEADCNDCTEYGIEDTYRCTKDVYYVLWLKDDTNNIERRFSNVDLVWKEFDNGTATLKGTVVDNNDPQYTMELDILYSGKTIVPPAESPKEHFCNEENSDDWVYYAETKGTIISTDGLWSLDILGNGPSFQLGLGANITEEEVGKYGASGWFVTNDADFFRGDIAINIGDCIDTDANAIEYEWSTGETTPSITVSEGGTYTVTVKDCENCEATDSVEVIVNTIDIDAGIDEEICKGEEVTLTAAVSGDSDCIDCLEEYTIENTDLCRQVNQDFVLCLVDNGQLRFFSNVDLVWKENEDGTAKLKGTVYDHTVTKKQYELDVNFSGETTYGHGGHLCNQEDNTGWMYYQEFSGSLTQQNGDWSLMLSKSGSPFQIGNGANAGEREQGKYGASGGFTTSDAQYTRGDININIGDCVAAQTSDISYLWSTGETTQSITVSPKETMTYTVTVQDNCLDCEASDTVEVKVNGAPQVDAGDDQEICKGGVVTLTAETNDATQCLNYIWSTGETTKSITVAPESDTAYFVTVSGCDTCGEATDEVFVTVSELQIDLDEEETLCTFEEFVLTSPIEADTYLWSTGETTQSIVVYSEEIGNATYSLTVTKNGCVAMDEILIITLDCQIDRANPVSIYPTLLKSNEKISLDVLSEKDQIISISIHDLSGALMGPIIQKNMDSGTGTKKMALDLNDFSKLSSGVYMVRIQGDGFDEVKKIVIN